MSDTQGVGQRAIAGGRLILLSIGLVVLRVAFGGTILLAHGWGKLGLFRAAEPFADPIGLGARNTLVLAVLAEVVCAGLVVLGLATRLATLPLIGTMAVAFFVVHADDAFEKKELALLYLAAFVTLLFTGPGRYSLDALFGQRLLKKKS